MSAALRAALHRSLLAWYRRHARDLPWRRTRDPWAIWVSEVMLQQTQVRTALPYYPRFLERFPTPRALARASESDVLAAWSGLGYYRRARQLREAAQAVVREHAGMVPRDADAFGALSGVGRYTRAAVLSMGFGTQLAALDGNVARVLSRLFMLQAAVREPRGARALWALAESLVSARAPGDWNQALMELGALVCTPRAPQCDACPLRRRCRAFASGCVAAFPPVVARLKIEHVRRAVILIEREGRVLMVKRQGRQLEGLWEPPGVDLTGDENAHDLLVGELIRHGVEAALEDTGRRIHHTITHRRIEVEVWRGIPEPSHHHGRSQPAGAVGAASTLVRYCAPVMRSVPLTALARELVRPPQRSKAAPRARKAAR